MANQSTASVEIEEVEIDEADLKAWRADARKELAVGKVKGAFAGPDNTFPIADQSDVGDAWGLAGKAADPDAVRRKIIAIAKKYDWTDGLPETAKAWAAEHNIELSEATFVAADAEHLVTLHTLAEADVAEGSGERISTVEVAQVGTYTDAHNKEVVITEASIDRMVANFEAQAAGQSIPIDIMHKKEEAGGWLKRVWRDGTKLLAEVSWNSMGARLVSDRIYRYLSASIAMPNWVLRSVSLVNFPAIKGLAPVELSEWLLSQTPSQDISQISKDANRRPHVGEHNVSTASPAKAGASFRGGSNMAENETSLQEATPDSPVVAEPNAQLAEFQAALEAGKDQIITEMMEKITAELATKRTEMLAQLAEQMQDERELSEFALSATATGAHALPVKPDELTAFLRELPKSQRQQAMELLGKIQQGGTVDMRELGTSAEGEDKRKLDPDMAKVARQFVATGGTIAQFFKANEDLGEPADYDLAEFAK